MSTIAPTPPAPVAPAADEIRMSPQQFEWWQNQSAAWMAVGEALQKHWSPAALSGGINGMTSAVGLIKMLCEEAKAYRAAGRVAAATEPAESGDRLWCETCEGLGTIDETLGGHSFSDPKAPCPDCDGKGWWRRAAPVHQVEAVGSKLNAISRELREQLATLGTRDHATLNPERYALAQRAVEALNARKAESVNPVESPAPRPAVDEGQKTPERAVVTDQMVSRFLGWKLPKNFSPDCGISFKRTYNENSPFGPQNHEPIGTNLLDATQARQMLEYVLGASPSPQLAASDGKKEQA